MDLSGLISEEGEWLWSSGKDGELHKLVAKIANTKNELNKMEGEDCALMNVEHLSFVPSALRVT